MILSVRVALGTAGTKDAKIENLPSASLVSVLLRCQKFDCRVHLFWVWFVAQLLYASADVYIILTIITSIFCTCFVFQLQKNREVQTQTYAVQPL